MSLLPVLVLLVVLGIAAFDRERDNYRAAAQARNRTMITALEANMEGHLAALRALAASSALERGDLQAFDAEARRVLPTQPAWRNIMLIAEDRLRTFDPCAAISRRMGAGTRRCQPPLH